MGDEKRMARTRYKEPSSRGEYNSNRIFNYTLLSGSCTYILASTYLAYSKTKQVNYSATTFYPLRYVPFIFTLFDALYARPMEIQFSSLRYLAPCCSSASGCIQFGKLTHRRSSFISRYFSLRIETKGRWGTAGLLVENDIYRKKERKIAAGIGSWTN